MRLAPPGIVLAGFMGAGKTSVGRALADLLGWSFVDLDEEIARDAGRSIAEIFASEGEAAFRRRESRAIEALVGRREIVVATGGGSVVSPENRALLYRIGQIVCLDAPSGVLWARASHSDRPLAQDRVAFMALLDRRRAVYRELPYHVPSRVSGQGGPERVARDIARRFVAPPATVRVPLGERAYDILVEPGGLRTLGQRLADVARPGRCLVLSHPPIWRRHGEAVAASLRDAGWQPVLAFVEPGEASKSLGRAQRLYSLMAEHRLERRDPLVAVGGGVVGDLGGFAAATYQRGIPYVQVPTTLLAQIDSSVGGKVAVNLAAGKNLVGAFHQPIRVVADPLALHTLPEREFRAGLAELIKYGVILDADLFAALERDMPAILGREVGFLVPLIARACELKSLVVSQDEREDGLRRILNFGHTIGHAIEKAAGYGRVRHGEAVAIGMVAAARLGERVGTCEGGTSDRIAALLTRAGLPVRTDLPAEALLAAMRLDKKVAQGAISWVLPERIGAVVIRTDIPEGDVRAALAQNDSDSISLPALK